MDKLKPCPFCGGRPSMNSLKTIIECFCLAQPAIEGHTPEDALAEWNTRTADTALAAAEARIAKLLEREQREAEKRKKQGLILDYAMRGLRHSDEHPDDGRMQAVRALAQHSECQSGRIAALEKALEPFAQAYKVYEPYSPVNAALASVSMEHLRRAAALLKEKE